VTATHLLGGALSCYRQTPFGYDISWGGTVGTPDHAIGYDSTDGSCSDVEYGYQLTFVLGDNKAMAQSNCDAVCPQDNGGTYHVANLLQTQN